VRRIKAAIGKGQEAILADFQPGAILDQHDRTLIWLVHPPVAIGGDKHSFIRINANLLALSYHALTIPIENPEVLIQTLAR
jgi:hypothetical protein